MRFTLSRCIRLQVVPLVLLSLGIACGAPVLDSTDVEITDTQPTQNAAPVTGDPVYFGVLAIDSAVSVNERYGPLLNYLSTEIGRPVELVILSQESQFTKVAEEALDFTTNNPLAAVQIQRLYDTEFLVTHTRPKTGAQFSGLIVVNADSDITSIQDLKGRKAACVNFQTAAAGCTFQIYHLLQNDFDPHKEFSSFVENKSQDNIVLAVLNGTIDVGFIRTGQLEKMVNKGLLNDLGEIRVIDAADDDFFYPHTTELYPEWPIAALSSTDPQLAEQMQAALLRLPTDHPALTTLKADSFIPAVNYDSLNRLVETLELKSWDADPVE
ncbi:phosphate/phosphite/phosphonate ABC transporter substrate-binding protein [Leptolyngbyaceae cyanobacterium CCMR0082]|uniref:Phosphate/phosphite/phosphonate ABC transporter substrate-binding protein n=1 Tax=Adonisia turfae CCMR0082 TaxID=2304604 RepID=A0A6M0SGD1_9CYAN|nr:phosphate/phosphite/phosphonate ABC transporter substrate-binding protein [Adonisia turfae]NEZ67021.1 phosphate/phosphite/phosphonate ABC transporter substrate-binding protein [Adonisia turfae CCMR0082]